MDVDSITPIRPLVFSLSILFCTACSADAGSKEIFDHVSKNILKATTAYGDRIGYCDKLVISNGVPKFDRKN